MYMADVGNSRSYYYRMAQFSLLVIDDDEALLQAIEDAIRFRLPDVTVSTSPSAEEALHLLTLHHYDVALSDIRMPLMDGYRLLSRIQHLKPAMPVLLMSGHLDEMRDAGGRICDPPQSIGPRVVNQPVATRVSAHTTVTGLAPLR
jgi:CheY-like chemotaxis protein